MPDEKAPPSAPTNSADDNAKPRSRFRPMQIIRNLILIYVTYCVIVFFAQRWLIFPDWIAPEPSADEKYDATTTVLTRDIDGGKVVAWFVPAAGASAENPKPLVIFLHGNAEIIDTQEDRIAGYRALGCSVLIPEYRGYGRSAGQPSQQALVDDAEYFLDIALKRPDVDPNRLVIHGRSMGGGIAAQLAARHNPRVLILGSTFTSMRTLGSRKALVPSFLIRHPMDTESVLHNLDVPLLIFHGSKDDIIDVSYGRELNAIAKHSRLVELDCSHNDFPGDEDDRYWNEIRGFLEENGVLPRVFPRQP
ncbi:MAG: alpha/beta hydrolase [Phycisphaerales bacterium]|nr:alpha/beta hydrolase [Phycisphaerales bacterium]MCB9854782.1 alpha/beta hydrolase [Phycisphaerales bacterium]MCB9863746.1 alpha/beta hydrolase [Phycisphaerales bacterium]